MVSFAGGSCLDVGQRRWIGSSAVRLNFPCVAISEQCIIVANSTVAKSIPPRTIAFGRPARVYKIREEKSQQWHLIDGR